MICISRKLIVDNKSLGSNFIYITSDNYNVDSNIIKGYLDGNTLNHNEVELNTDWNLESIEFRDVNISKCAIYSKY
jgi:hypothetical protein